MRTLVMTQNVTVDGAVEMLDDWFDAQRQGTMDDLLEENHRQRSAADALVLGRRTFLDMRGYWRELDDDTTGNTQYLNQVEKYVVTATLTDPDWDHTTVLPGDPVDQVRRLKQADGADIVVTGSITLSHALIRADLVDEFRLFVYPVVQGRGRRLFPEGWRPDRLHRVAAQPFRGGITLLTYSTD